MLILKKLYSILMWRIYAIRHTDVELVFEWGADTVWVRDPWAGEFDVPYRLSAVWPRLRPLFPIFG